MADAVIRILRKLADGWLGATYRALEPSSSRQLVARSINLPFLRAQDARSRLASLCTALKSPPEPGIVPVLGSIQQEDGSVLLTSPWVDGDSFAALVDKKPGEAPSHSLWMVRELAVLLDACHRAGLRHLALRPTQVVVQPSAESERGIAIHLSGVGLAEALRQSRPTGLPEHRKIFLAPEQQAPVSGESAPEVDEKADVYALGVLVLYLLFGKTPTAEQVQRCASDAETALTGHVVRNDTARFLKSMLAREPRQRPNMSEVSRELGIESQAALLDATLAPPAFDGYAKTEASASPIRLNPDAVRTVPEESSRQQPGLLYGNFRIVRRIGQGGMGVVYEAEHKQIGRRAAVKILHPMFAKNQDYASRFLNEARAVNIVRHPGLVEIFEYGQQPDGTLYIVMEYLQGESMRARLEKSKEPSSVLHILEWATQIARALTATHEKGIIHRDLKPENIRLVEKSASGFPAAGGYRRHSPGNEAGLSPSELAQLHGSEKSFSADAAIVSCGHG